MANVRDSKKRPQVYIYIKKKNRDQDKNNTKVDHGKTHVTKSVNR